MLRHLILLALTLVAALALIVVLAITDALRGQILGFLGILLSAALALSSTTLLGNALAGRMLRAVRSFHAGDFIQAGEHFGRVAIRGLFCVEVQAEDRSLTTLPNLFLATSPLKVIRSSGAIVTAEVSLGYDVPRTRVEELLLAAASERTRLDAAIAALREQEKHVKEEVEAMAARLDGGRKGDR